MGENFNRVFAESGGKTAISDSQYDGGMDFIGDVPPEFEDHNAIFNEQDRKLLELKTDGVASWDAEINYFANRSTVAGSDGKLYQCLIDSVGIDPVGDVSGTWVVFDQGVGSAGQSWQDLTASRASGVNYTNTTGRPIQIYIYAKGTSLRNVIIDGVAMPYSDPDGSVDVSDSFSAIIPNGSIYSTDNNFAFWGELR